MQTIGAVLASTVRVAVLEGGPFDRLRLMVAERPAIVCRGGEHHLHDESMPGLYVHVGRCVDYHAVRVVGASTCHPDG